ncbi:MAG: hypothetical protein IKE74_10455 [Mogibacterium sp.]|nr:hypothetical protein [Mogibacterium sp.]
MAVFNADEDDEVILDKDIVFDGTTGFINFIYIGANSVTIKSSGSERYKLDLKTCFIRRRRRKENG